MGVARKLLNWYARLSPSRGRVSPPYQHVVQVGDPVLRRICEKVPQEKIKSEEIQNVIKKLHYVMDKYGSVGLSAPQIGVNLRIFVMRFTSKDLSSITPEFANLRGVTLIPYSVFINPKLKVLDYQKVIHHEGCESVRGFLADVPRYKEIQVSGHNENAEPVTQSFKDWSARIVQHEVDHLEGKLYVDLMDRKSLQCSCWQEVNLSQGKIVLPFTPE